MRKEIEKLAKDFVAHNPKGRSLICQIDGQKGQLRIAYQAKVIRPATSLTKLALAIALSYALKDGTLRQNEVITVSDLPKTSNPSFFKTLSDTHQLSWIELGNIMLSLSDNSAAEMIFKQLGPEWVVQVLKEYNINNTTHAVGYADGLLNERSAANKTTSEDALQMLGILLEDDWFKDSLHNNFYRQRIGGQLAWNTNLANKTGTLASLGLVHDVGVYLGQSHRLRLAFLCENEFGSGNPIERCSNQIATFVRDVALVLDEQVKASANPNIKLDI